VADGGLGGASGVTRRWSAQSTAVVIVVLLAMALALQIYSAHQREAEHAKGLVSAMTNSLAGQIGASFRGIDAMLEDLTAVVRAGQWDSPAQRQRFSGKLEAFPEILWFGLVDANGHLAPDTIPPLASAPDGVDVSDRDYFTGHDGGRAPVHLHIGAPVIGRATHVRTIHLSRPVFGRDGKFLGIAVAALSADTYARELESALLDPAGGSSLIRMDGLILARAPAQPEMFGLDIAASDLFTRWVPNSVRGVARLQAKTDGNLKLLGYQRLDRYPLLVTSGLSCDVVFSEWQWLAWVEVFIATLFAAAILYWARQADSRESRLQQQHAQLETMVDDRTGELRREIAERQLVEEELLLAKQRAEGASRAKSSFLAMMRHELRTPLNAVLGFSEMIRDQLLGPIAPPQYREYGDYIHSSAEHLLGVLNGILDLASIDVGQLRMVEELAVPDDICRSAVALMAPSAVDRRIRLEADLSGHLPLVRVDERLIRQALVSVLSNAIKFTEPGGLVTLHSEERLEGIALVVSDTGIGMSEEDVKRAMEAFAQLDERLVRQYEGTGVGLALAEACMRIHGGTMAVRSEKGNGTEVCLLIPAHRIVEEGADAVGLPSGAAQGVAMSPLSTRFEWARSIGDGGGILIVDDLPTSQLLLAGLLAREGYFIRTADGGKAALEAVAAKVPDLILLDVEMPLMDGFEVCRRLKRDDRLRDVPVVFVSVGNEQATKVAAFDAGGVDFIGKPFHAQEVLARVRNHLDLHHAREQVRELDRSLSEATDELARLAQTDGMLGIANRLHFDQALAREWEQHEGSPLALVMVDVDGLATYNETYGHLAGDACLKRIARIAASALREPGGLLARFGAGNLAILLPHSDEEGALAVARDIQLQVKEAGIAHASTPVAGVRFVTVSIGVSASPPAAGGEAKELVSAAVRALRLAKEGGRNRIRCDGALYLVS
jgi:diguanylate cyclase (GGDEF)-like protein